MPYVPSRAAGDNPQDRSDRWGYDPRTDPAVVVLPGSPGGDTYYVTDPKIVGASGGKSLCWRMKKSGTEEFGWRCTKPAGWGTDHPGTGACKYHGGVNAPKLITVDTAYGKHLAEKYQATYQSFLDIPEPKSLHNELALLRVLLTSLVEKKGWDIKEIRDTLEAIGRMVDRMERIDMAHAITQAQVQLLVVHMVSLIRKFVTDRERRLAFATEFLSLFGIEPDDNGRLPRGSVSDGRVIELAKTQYGMHLKEKDYASR